MELLDESLITSDVCLRCGHCCKVTTQYERCSPDGVEWWAVIASESDLIEVIIHPTEKQARIRIHCPKLKNQDGLKVCSIYEDRPTVCRKYNCFRTANLKNQRPENWNYIKGIVDSVHGTNIEWKGKL